MVLHYIGVIDEAVIDVFSIIKDELDNWDYAFMGYSMGTLIAYELISKIKKEGIKGPEHAFLCAKEPPHIKSKEENLHKMPNNEFIKEIIKLGGTPNELLEEKELLDFF